MRADAENGTISAEIRDQAQRVLRFIESINSGMRMEISLAPIAAKIDLAAMVKE